MKDFVISITERLRKKITVPAETSDEAIEKVKAIYETGDIVLDENDYCDCDIEDETDELGDFADIYPSIECYISEEDGAGENGK